MKAYTIGIPIATVLFIALIIGSLLYVTKTKPPKDLLAAESIAVLADIRNELAFIPKVNADRTAVTAYVTGDNNVTTLRIHGLTSRPLQSQLIDHIRQARAENDWRPIVVNFHYPQARPEPLSGQSLVNQPTSAEQPEPFRTERL